jgi:hypothetical protein
MYILTCLCPLSALGPQPRQVLDRIAQIDDQIETLQETFVMLEEEESQEENTRSTVALKRVREKELNELARLEMYMQKLKGEADLTRLAYLKSDDMLAQLQAQLAKEGNSQDLQLKQQLAHHKNKRLVHLTELKSRRKQGEAVDLQDLQEEEGKLRAEALQKQNDAQGDKQDYAALSSLGVLLKRRQTLKAGEDVSKIKLKLEGAQIDHGEGVYIDDNGQCHVWDENRGTGGGWVLAKPAESLETCDTPEARACQMVRKQSLARKELAAFVTPTKKRPNHVRSGLVQTESGKWRKHREAEELHVDPWKHLDECEEMYEDEMEGNVIRTAKPAGEGPTKCGKCGAEFVAEGIGAKSRLCGDCNMEMKKKKREMMIKKKKAKAAMAAKKAATEDVTAQEEQWGEGWEQDEDGSWFNPEEEGCVPAEAEFDLYTVTDPTASLPDECFLSASAAGLRICAKDGGAHLHTSTWEAAAVSGSSAPDPEDMDDLMVTIEIDAEDVEFHFECDDKWDLVAAACDKYRQREGGLTHSRMVTARTMKVMV